MEQTPHIVGLGLEFRRGRFVEVDDVRIEKPILFQEERSETGSILA
jgi:hypothetical protein